MAEAAAKPKRDRSNENQTRWHTAVAEAPPDGDTLEAVFAQDITEVRWDAHPSEPGRFQWFMLNRHSIRPLQWRAIEVRLRLAPLKEEHRIQKVNRNRPLWREYMEALGLPNLESNVRVSPSAAPKPAKRKRPEPAAAEAPVAAICLPPPPPPAVPAPPTDGHREFLLAGDPLERVASRPRIVHAIESLLLQHVEPSEAVRRFLSTRNTQGIGCLYPRDCPKHASHPPADVRAFESGTLEMHRRAMRLERLASDLLVMLSGAGREGLGADMAADLGCALAFWGGAGAEGDALWRDPGGGGAGSGPSSSGLQQHLAWMAANRGDALTRFYAVADELNWGLPLLATIWRGLQERKGSPRVFDHIVCQVSECSRIRTTTHNRDKARLVAYGAHLTAVCQRLQAIASALQPPLPPQLTVASPEGGPPAAIPFDLEHAWKCGAGRLELSPARRACEQRLHAEETEVREMLRGLSLAQSPAVQAAQALRRRQLEEMRTDTHARQATAHLPPTPSLPAAAFDPRQYIPS